MTNRGAAVRYARALFDVAVKEADVEQVGREFGEFVGLVTSNPELMRVLTNPAIPPARKRAVVEQLLKLAGALSPVVAKVLLLLADNDRLVLLPEMATAYRERLMQHLNVVRAQVVTAMPVAPGHLDALREGLERATGRDVQMETRVDGSLIGGAVTRVGSTVYDGSIATQLRKLQHELASTE